LSQAMCCGTKKKKGQFSLYITGETLQILTLKDTGRGILPSIIHINRWLMRILVQRIASGGTDHATEQRVRPRYVLCAPTTGLACDTTLGASSNLPVRDPAASSEPESSCHHVHRQNRSPAIAPMRARCWDDRADWPPAAALDRQKGACRPFAHGLSLGPTHPECSPDPVRATASALPASRSPAKAQ